MELTITVPDRLFEEFMRVFHQFARCHRDYMFEMMVSSGDEGSSISSEEAAEILRRTAEPECSLNVETFKLQ